MSVTSRVYLRLRWLTAEEGGRDQLPVGAEYRGVAQADGAEEGWSVRLAFIGSANRAEATFLMPEAKEQLGVQYWGKRFWLVEGSKRVAEAQVLTPTFRLVT